MTPIQHIPFYTPFVYNGELLFLPNGGKEDATYKVVYAKRMTEGRAVNKRGHYIAIPWGTLVTPKSYPK